MALRGDPFAGLFEDMGLPSRAPAPRVPTVRAPRRRSLFYEPPAPRVTEPEEPGFYDSYLKPAFDVGMTLVGGAGRAVGTGLAALQEYASDVPAEQSRIRVRPDSTIWDDLRGLSYEAPSAGQLVVEGYKGLAGAATDAATKAATGMEPARPALDPRQVSGVADDRWLTEGARLRDVPGFDVASAVSPGLALAGRAPLPAVQAAAEGAGQFAGEIATDPMTVPFLAASKGLQVAEAAYRALPTTATAERLAAARRAVEAAEAADRAQAAFALPSLVEGTVSSGAEAIRQGREHGAWSPEAVAPATQAILSGLMTGASARDLVRRPTAHVAPQLDVGPDLQAMDELVAGAGSRRQAPQDDLAALDALVAQRAVDAQAERDFLRPDLEAAAMAEQARLARAFREGALGPALRDALEAPAGPPRLGDRLPPLTGQGAEDVTFSPQALEAARAEGFEGQPTPFRPLRLGPEADAFGQAVQGAITTPEAPRLAPQEGPGVTLSLDSQRAAAGQDLEARAADYEAALELARQGKATMRELVNGLKVSPSRARRIMARLHRAGAITSIDVAAARSAPPTSAQREAGNYQKGTARVAGLDIAVETPAGSRRRPEWPELRDHYGYFKGTKGKDKDQVDVFVRPGTPDTYDGPVFVVDQKNAQGGLDEHKTMLGFGSEADARAAYVANYGGNEDRIGSIATFDNPEAFRAWLKNGDKKQPAAGVMRDLQGNRILPGQEDWAPEKRAAVHGAADAIVADVVQGQRSQPAGRKPILGGPAQNSVEGYYGVPSSKTGTALEDLPYSPRQMAEALEKDRGNPIELDIHEAVARDERVQEALQGQPTENVPFDVDSVERGPDRRQAATEMPAEMDRRREERRARIAAENDLDVQHPAVERMAQLEERAEAAEDAAGTDVLTGLGNRRAYEAAARDAKASVSFDVAGLKWFNDTHGHGAGDVLLRALGDAIRAEPGIRGFRTGGDEFYLHAETPEAAENAARNVQERLAGSQISYTKPDGETVSWTGGRVDYGVGRSQEAADAALLESRRAAEARGERAPRGARPAGLVEVAAPGREVRDQAPAPERGGAGRPEPEAGPPVQLGEDRSRYGPTERTAAGDQALIAGTLDAAASGPRPRTEGREADGPLFTQEQDRAARETEAREKAAQGRLFEEGPGYGQDDLGFYSALSRAAESMPQAMRGADALRYLSDPKRGVKADELKWTGLDDFLRERDNQRVTPAEIQKFLAENRVEVKEVRLAQEGEAGTKTPEQWQAEADREERIAQQWQRNGDENQARRHFDRAEQAQRYAEGLNEAGTTRGTPKFGKWQLPGGENYREVLLTLPSKDLPDAVAGERFYQTWIRKGGDPAWSDLSAERQNDIVKQMPKAARTETRFHGGHFEEPDILAHVRLNDRTDADGKRVLFVEEIQSDWAQKGRREGFQDGDQYEPEQLKARRLWGDMWEVAERGNGQVVGRFPGADEAAAIREALPGARSKASVPNAPFVTDTEKWTDLALKRVLRMAAEGGYDRVAWTTGEQQAARYDLSKQVKEVRYQRTGDGTYDVDVRGLNGDRVLEEGDVPLSRVEELLGKDIAEKVQSGGTGFRQWQSLSGLDLKVGGEGMRAFYDQMVPQRLAKLGKKWGAKVGSTALPERVARFETEAQARSYLDRNDLGDQVSIVRNDSTPEEPFVIMRARESVHSIDVTPEMRASVMQGQALFEPKLDYQRAGADLRGREGRAGADIPADRVEAHRDARVAVDELLSGPVRNQGLRVEAGRPGDDARGVRGPGEGGATEGRGFEPAGSGVRTLAVGIRGDLVNKGWVDLRGHTIRHAEDVAVLAQVYRDPRFETYRVFYVDREGKLLAHEGFTSRMPGRVDVFTPGNKARQLEDMRDRMRRLGADGYYLVHNHPSGRPMPSADDMGLSRAIESDVDGFKGHVVIDSGEYGYIPPTKGDRRAGGSSSGEPMRAPTPAAARRRSDSSTNGSIFRLPTPTRDVLLSPSIENKALGVVMTNPGTAALVAKDLNTNPRYVTLLFLDAQSKVRAIQEMPTKLFQRVKEASDYIRGRSRVFGSGTVVAYHPEGARDVRYAAYKLVRNGTLVDGITGGRSETNLGNKADVGMEMGRPQERRRERVSASAVPYVATAPTRTVPAPAPPPAPAAPATIGGQAPGTRAAAPPKPSPGGIVFPAETKADRFTRLLVDKMARAWKVIDTVRAQGGNTAEGDAFRELAETVQSKTAEKIEDIGRDLVQPMIGELSKGKIKLDDLGDYLQLLHKPTRDAVIQQRTGKADGSGWTQAEADARWAELEQKYGTRQGGAIAKLEPAAKHVRAMRDEQLRVLQDGGLISKEQAQAWRDTYGDTYVPLRHFETEEGFGTGTGFKIRGPEAERATGRSTIAENPVAFMLEQLQRAVIRAEKNKADQAFGRFVEDNDLFRRGQGTDSIGDADFVYKVDGQEHRVDIASVDPLLDRAMKNLSAAETASFVNSIGKVTRKLTQLWTTYSPEFAFTNWARDIQTAAVNASTEQGPKIAAATVKGAPQAIRGMWQALRKPSANPTGWERYAKEFREDGGAVGFYMLENAEQLGKALEGQLKTAGPGLGPALKRIGKGVIGIVGDANKAVENGTRLSFYRAMREAGVPRQKAAVEAKKLTVNFERKGEWNSAVNSLYAFFNAGVQGTARTVEVLAKNPKGRKVAAGLATAGFLLDQMNRGLAGDENDDGTNDYDAIPEYVKERNLIVMTGKKPLMIPLPYGLNVLLNLGRVAGAVKDGAVKPGDGAMAMGGGVLNAFNPLGGSDGFVQTLIPTVLDPVVESATNRDFTGKPLRPEQYPGQAQKPDSQLYFRNVPGWARTVASALNRATGGDDVTSGHIDVSPETIDHYFNFVGGGLARFSGNVLETGKAIAKGEAPETRTTPVARRFVYDESPGLQATRFRENQEELETLRKRYETYRSRNDPKAADISRPMLRVARYVHQVDLQIDRIRRAGAAVPDADARIRALQVRANRAVASARKEAAE